MWYPLKFEPVYKNYLWGGRNLAQMGRLLPEGKVAESWEVSCHPDGVSIIDNGRFRGMSFTDYLAAFGEKALGAGLTEFPLLVKLIDANDRLSVQVHPNDEYAAQFENGENGKSEMWYVLAAKPGAKMIYDLQQGVTQEEFAAAVKSGAMEGCFRYLEVAAGDIVYVPAGLVHALGEGLVVVEVQQSSNVTYRLFDYDRTDAQGNKRPLHVEKAMEVISYPRVVRGKTQGLELPVGKHCRKRFLMADPHFTVELYTVAGSVEENCQGGFHVYTVLEGRGEVQFGDRESMSVNEVESFFIPAALKEYTLCGDFKALKAYVPNRQQALAPLLAAGFSWEEITGKVDGLK